MVVGLDRNTDQKMEWPLVQVDVTSEASVEAGFREVYEGYGQPDCVIHTVGMWAMSPIVETKFSDWNRLIQLNLSSSFLVFKHAIQTMGGTGSLIGIASRQGVVKGASGQAGYSASKGGLVRLVESIAAEYDPTELHAHVVAPSTILFEQGQTGGVHAGELAGHCLYLASDKGASLSGTVLEAYGNG
jgi:3-oxoacyl-[acyl-carrier protein] reductase